MAEQTLDEMLQGLPNNWGRWGDDDEIGGLNFLTPEEVLRGVRSVRSGRVVTLGMRIGNPEGDPVWPGRSQALRLMTQDKGEYLAGKLDPLPGGLEYADDFITMYLQGTTQFDGLGHTWFGDQLWNGYDASTTVGGLQKASVLPLAEHGIAGRGVLVDMARYYGVDSMEKGQTFGVEELQDAARQQGLEIQRHDILCIRTAFLQRYWEEGEQKFYTDFKEPGLAFSPELVRWFHETEIPVLATDTIANEVTSDPKTGALLPLHAALMRNLGVLFSEICDFEELSEACAEAGQWDFLYTAAPLKVVNGTGAPVNPVAVL